MAQQQLLVAQLLACALGDATITGATITSPSTLLALCKSEASEPVMLTLKGFVPTTATTSVNLTVATSAGDQNTKFSVDGGNFVSPAVMTISPQALNHSLRFRSEDNGAHVTLTYRTAPATVNFLAGQLKSLSVA